jgi:hypothetical protein
MCLLLCFIGAVLLAGAGFDDRYVNVYICNVFCGAMQMAVASSSG